MTNPPPDDDEIRGWTPRDAQSWRVVRRRALTRGGVAANVAVGTGLSLLAITFGKPEPDSKYGVQITPSWLTAVSVSGKSTTGFTANFSTSAPAGGTIDWSVFRSEVTDPTAGAGGGGGITASATPDDASLVTAQHVYRGPPPASPDVRAGANITVTRDAQGFTIAGTGGGTAVDDGSMVTAQHVYRGPPPALPDVRAGASVTVTRDAQGYVVAAPADDGSHVVASKVYAVHPPAIPDVRAGANASVTRDAQGYVVALGGTGIPVDDGSLVTAQHVYRTAPWSPETLAGTAITIVRDARGYNVNVAVADANNILANQVFGS